MNKCSVLYVTVVLYKGCVFYVAYSPADGSASPCTKYDIFNSMEQLSQNTLLDAINYNG